MKITDSDLDKIIDSLNIVTGSPTEVYKDGKAQIGCFCLECAYGKVGLNRISNSSAAVEMIFSLTTKRDLYDQIRAFIAGYNFARR